MDKQILTWTNLCNMAARVAKHRPDDYKALVTGGTDRFLPGYYTHVAHDRSFRIFRGAEQSGPIMVEISGVYSDKGYFTKIKHSLTPTAYRKRFWDRYMPVSFPNGLPLRGASEQCLFHAASGGRQQGAVTFSQRRKEVATFTVHCEAQGWLLVNDTTGRLVHIHDCRCGAPSAGEAIEVYAYDLQDRDTWRNFPWYRQATLSDSLRGVPDGAVTSRGEWLKSIWRACEAGLMDKYKCLPLAARMWNAAYRFCQANADKQARMVSYPIEALATGKVPTHGVRCLLEWKNTRFVTVDGEQEGIPLNATDAVHYRLPQLDIWWEGEWNEDAACNNPVTVGSTRMDPRFVTMVLPPHGNPLLYDKPHYAAPHCRTAPSQARMNGEHVHRSDAVVTVLSEDRLVVQFLERAYHSLTIYEPSQLDHVEGPYICNRMYNRNTCWAESDTKNHPHAKWRDHEARVMVKSNFDEARHGKDGPWATYTQTHSGMPATPESAVSMVEEAALIDSLPLS
jgi:hypothetical protein